MCTNFRFPTAISAFTPLRLPVRWPNFDDMPYCTQIKAGGITSLTNARFFASFQVDWLGFNLDPLAEKPLSMAKMEDMKTWLVHDGLVGEFDNRGADEVLHLAGILGLQGVQIPYSMPGRMFQEAGITVFRYLQIDAGSLPLALDDRDTDFLVLHIPGLTTADHAVQEQVQRWCEDHSILLHLPADKQQVVPAWEKWHPAGIDIRIQDEIRPGVQEFDSMLDLLEALEV